MLLAKEFVHYVSRQVVEKLTPHVLETADTESVAAVVEQVILDELMIEDRINDEVREILEQYSDYMRRESISYMEMFRRTKKTLLAERKVVRASGRDTGDDMKLSRDKVNEISHKLLAALKLYRDVRLKKKPNDVRLELVREISNLLRIEDKVDREARKKVQSLKRDVPEGSEEWDILRRRYYAEELRRFGIELPGS